MLFPITFSIPKEKICDISIQKTKIQKPSLDQGGSVCKIWDRSVQPFYRDDETFIHTYIL